jgi:hypothetical protein
MRKLLLLSVILGCVGSNALAGDAAASAHAVEYMKVCSLYGNNFYYMPGTDICLNTLTGDARQQTAGGTLRSQLPYPKGKWILEPAVDCKRGSVVNVGSFASTDFVLNVAERKETAPVDLKLSDGRFISKVYWSGGFYDPRVPEQRNGLDGAIGLCLRLQDPDVLLPNGDGFFAPPNWAKRPISCVWNSRIRNMPAIYSTSAAAAYPAVEDYFYKSGQVPTGAITLGSQLIVSTDLGNGGEHLLTYFDVATGEAHPLAGTISVSVCVQPGLE